MRFNVCDTLTLLWSCLLGHQFLWWKRLAGLSKVIWWAFGGRLMGHFNGFGRRLVGIFRGLVFGGSFQMGLAGHFRWIWWEHYFSGNVDGAFHMELICAGELFG